ncbi:MAG TPA: PSD1 and planctomycete cytochrome C domain-containing protein [Candidatus Sulfotelmatobacter sp.]|nr:PSD1 and planctomycete cytochrome C domain-containing protein [Candidatus Sulfotelmatobacter sp.]
MVLLAVVLTCAALGAWFAQKMSHRPISFSHDIQPILNQNCVQCHGGVRQKNGVSFIFREEALGTGKSGRRTIMPGHPDESELIRRVTSSEPDARMPYHSLPLSPQQIKLLRQWIKEGAKWEDHWAFVAPKPQPLPAVTRSDWIRQPLDRFILARLEKERLAPAPEADKSELLRRASFDLTGLPPTLGEQASFLADSSPNAYEKQVDRMLASPRYGERWAALWLDLARYADTKGYEADRERPGVWPYRDWVIQAFNRNVPYDKFVITQLAGDLLPDTAFEDQIATSFHRQTPNNDEGGTDDEEFRLIAAMDRSATTWSVLNGLTINCVQCHSHPYDPIRHAEYYKSLAFFNTSRDADLPEDTPVLRVPKDKKRYEEAWSLQQEIAKLSHSTVYSGRQLESQATWMPLPITTASANEALALEWEAANSERELAALDNEKLPPKEKKDKRKYLLSTIAENRKLSRSKGANASVAFQVQDGEMRAAANTPGKSVYELVATANVQTMTALRIEVLPTSGEAARHNPEDGFIVDQVEAWVVQPNGKQDKIRFRYFIPDSEDDLKSAIARAIQFGPTSELAGSFAANPNLFRTHWIVGLPDTLLKLTRGSQIKMRLTQTQNVNDKPAHVRRASLSASSDSCWSQLIQDQEYRSNLMHLSTLSQQLKKIPSVETPVMAEQPDYEKRETLEFERGNFLTKIGPALTPDVPGLFPRLPDNAPRNRLTLAKWFFSPEQPLTARTAVNRYWEQLFGTGIVETLENFGSMGERPSHPELLDWLAIHFENDLHWDIKALLRELVTSATYRQSARSTPSLTERDPRNRLLARGPQQRLSAEMVRDQALIASGLLSDTMGGPPVMPPQPEGVWNSVYNDSKWVDAKGPNRYRRAIYTYIKRTSGYPTFLIFDASDHDVSLARRIPTNTPLQALVTMNDPVYQESSEALADRMLKAADKTDDRLRYGARLVLSRDPTDYELAKLRELFEKALVESEAGIVKRAAYSKAAPRNEKRAMTAVASVLFNLDAALTR